MQPTAPTSCSASPMIGAGPTRARTEIQPSRRRPSINSPAEEPYDLASDPYQLSNVATRLQYAEAKQALEDQLMAKLKATLDPRVVGDGDQFDGFLYRRAGSRAK